jgi:hypothetical protein
MKKNTIRARVHENIKGREDENEKSGEEEGMRNKLKFLCFHEETVKTSFCKVSRRYLQRSSNVLRKQ